MRRWIGGLAALGLLAVMATPGQADEAGATVYMKVPGEEGREAGTVGFMDGPYGLLVTPDLTGLPPGLHGAHIHKKSDCADPKGHYDPERTDRHEGPYGEGHLGDLPALMVDQQGQATTPALAPRLTVADLDGRSMVIHMGGDNYSDAPKENGGGGAHLACGSIR